jgi:hypothetical protein
LAAGSTLTAERLFREQFLPLYPPGADLAQLRSTDANPARNPRILAQLDEIAAIFAKLAPQALGHPDLALDFSDASVHRLAAAVDRDRRDALIASGDLVQLVTHGAVYVGSCVVRRHGGVWQVRSPLWESLVRLESRAGSANLALFQWWLKALSDDEVDEPRLADRYHLHVEVPAARPEELPLIAPPDRRLPRLKKVRYHTLHQHLAAHLPELRGLGDHFPSAERFAELAFHWLDFALVGGGRMLVMHGPTDAGVHVFWLDAAGFASAAFFACDALPEHRLEQRGDTLAIHLWRLGREELHPLLWWGPSRADAHSHVAPSRAAVDPSPGS